ncbi:MAG: HAD-IC family P-type ATPase, partial [Lactococcus sp.]|nr:HAD-IC family P-type ATPase [Lactococcus sp.]
MKWYQLTKEAILSKLQTTDKGIQDIERQQRLEANGFNKIEEKQALKPWQKFFKHFTDLLMIVLLFASILKMITGDYVESAIIFLVVIINGLVGYWQERKAQDSLDGLKQMMGQEAVVLSDGVKATIPNETVVVGDIVSLNAGDVVPADLRLIDVHDLIIEESILTGESEPVEKHAHLIEAESAIGDQTNMAFSGTLVQSGSALGIVVATGSNTEIGKINQALQSIQQQTTPLVKKMNDLNQQLF